MLYSPHAQKLLQAGFSEQEVADFYENRRRILSQAGFSSEEITKHFKARYGIDLQSEKDIQDTTPIREALEQIGNPADYGMPAGAPVKAKSAPAEDPKNAKLVQGDTPHQKTLGLMRWKAYLDSLGKVAEDPFEAMLAGYQHSVTGLMARGEAPDTRLGESPSPAQMLGFALGMIPGDLPANIIGAGIGTAGGTPASIAASALAVPAGFRSVLMDTFTKGATTSDNFMSRLGSAVTEMAKEALIGAIAGQSGAISKAATAEAVASGAMRPGVASAIQLGSEVTSMTYAAGALRGELPDMTEFISSAITMGTLRSASFYIGKFDQLYRNTGIRPRTAEKWASLDPSVREDLASINHFIPRMMRLFVKEDGTPTEAAAIVGGKKKQNTVIRDLKHAEELLRLDLEKLPDPKTIKTASERVHEIYTKFFDQLHPLNKGAAIGETTPAYLAARLLPATPAKVTYHFLKRGTLPFQGTKPNGKGLEAILKPIKDSQQFEAFLLATQTSAVQEGPVPIRGPRSAASKQLLNNLDPEVRKQYMEVHRELMDYSARLLDYALDAGIIGKNQHTRMMQQRGMFLKYHDKGLSSVSDATLTKIFGPGKTQNPIESLIHNTHTVIKLADTNYVKRLAAEQFGKELVMRKDVDKAAGRLVEVFSGQGDKKYYEVPHGIADVFLNLNADQAKLFTQVFSVPAKWLRAGTAITPEFMAKDFIRNNFQAAVYSQHGFSLLTDPLKGLAIGVGRHIHDKTGLKVFKPLSDIYYEWVAAGGAHSSLVSVDRNYLGDVARQLYKTPVRNLVSPENLGSLAASLHPRALPRTMLKVATDNPVLRTLHTLSELNDQSARLAEYYNARKLGKSPHEAAYASRELTQDFARIGAVMQGYNQLTAFANSAIQGLDRFGRELAKDPIGTQAKITAGIVIPTFLLALARADIVARDPNSDMAKRIQEAAPWEKDMFWLIPGQDGVLWKVAKPFELGAIYGTPVERFVEHLQKNEGDVSGYLTYLQETGALGNILENMLPPMIPTAASPIIELASNHSFHTGLPVIPAGMERVLPEIQYTPATSELGKKLASMMSQELALQLPQGARNFFSPIGIDHLIKSWSGGFGRNFLAITNQAAIAAGMTEKKPDFYDTDNVWKKAFQVRYPSPSADSIVRYRNRIDEAETRYNTIMTLIERGDPRGQEMMEQIKTGRAFKLPVIRQAMANIQGSVNAVYHSPVLTAEEKDQQLRILYAASIDIAKAGNEAIDEIRRVFKQSDKKD